MCAIFTKYIYRRPPRDCKPFSPHLRDSLILPRTNDPSLPHINHPIQWDSITSTFYVVCIYQYYNIHHCIMGAYVVLNIFILLDLTRLNVFFVSLAESGFVERTAAMRDSFSTAWSMPWKMSRCLPPIVSQRRAGFLNIIWNGTNRADWCRWVIASLLPWIPIYHVYFCGFDVF